MNEIIENDNPIRDSIFRMWNAMPDSDKIAWIDQSIFGRIGERHTREPYLENMGSAWSVFMRVAENGTLDYLGGDTFVCVIERDGIRTEVVADSPCEVLCLASLIAKASSEALKGVAKA
jgi:hypothetical protein